MSWALCLVLGSVERRGKDSKGEQDDSGEDDVRHLGPGSRGHASSRLRKASRHCHSAEYAGAQVRSAVCPELLTRVEAVVGLLRNGCRSSPSLGEPNEGDRSTPNQKLTPCREVDPGWQGERWQALGDLCHEIDIGVQPCYQK